MAKPPDPTDVLIGQNIRAWRLANEMTQAELAELLRVTPQQVSQYEYGINRVGGGRLFRIADVLRVPVAHLLGASEGPEGPWPDTAAYSEQLQLVRTFARIEDGALRRAVLDLVTHVADAAQAGPGRGRPSPLWQLAESLVRSSGAARARQSALSSAPLPATRPQDMPPAPGAQD